LKRYPRTKCIGIDVDGTLIQNGKLNRRLAEWAKVKKEAGFEVVLWTAQGKEHAEKVAQKYGIEDHFTAIIGKPGYVVDDLGWAWVKFTKIVRGFC
jgi:hydroxymethylpyrimidine pyrophosphatase-like HAD family hydrolase